MTEVSLQGVRKSFDQAIVIDDIDLTIESGEFVTLLGPSGCGKTTTLRIVAGLERPDDGTVLIGGQNVTYLPIRDRQIGMVFQGLALFPHMTVGENVAFGLRMRRISRDAIKRRVSEALDLVQIGELSARLPSQLSGGQQQRVALARAFVTEPTVMLLDEPLAALDRKLREEMQVEIRKLAHRLGITAIFVTHDQQEALILSDRVAVMNNGVIEQIDRPETVFSRPSTPFVADFMGVTNLLSGTVSGDDAQWVQIEDADQCLWFEGAEKLAPGAPVRIGLRPDDAELSLNTVPNAVNDMACRVETAIYQGNMVTIEAQLTGTPGMRLIARVPARHAYQASDALQPDSKIWLSWSPESVLIFQD